MCNKRYVFVECTYIVVYIMQNGCGELYIMQNGVC